MRNLIKRISALLLCLLLLFQHLGVQSVANELGQLAPRIQLDGRNLHEGQEDYERPAPRCKKFLDVVDVQWSVLHNKKAAAYLHAVAFPVVSLLSPQ